MTKAKHIAYWLPSTFAIIMMSVSGIVMLQAVSQARDAARANLFNTCYNADRIRPESASQCWQDYTEVTGKEPHER